MLHIAYAGSELCASVYEYCQTAVCLSFCVSGDFSSPLRVPLRVLLTMALDLLWKSVLFYGAFSFSLQNMPYNYEVISSLEDSLTKMHVLSPEILGEMSLQREPR